MPRFEAACQEASRLSWNPKRIDSFNPRQIRGSSLWSMHAYALAWDFFATGPTVPPPGGVWTPDNGLPPEFAACFERQGFTWGGRWSGRRDVPHIEWNQGRPGPPVPIPTAKPAPPKPILQEDDDVFYYDYNFRKAGKTTVVLVQVTSKGQTRLDGAKVADRARKHADYLGLAGPVQVARWKQRHGSILGAPS